MRSKILVLFALSALVAAGVWISSRPDVDKQTIRDSDFAFISPDSPVVVQGTRVVFEGRTQDLPARIQFQGELRRGPLPVLSISRNGEPPVWGLGIDGERIFLIAPHTEYKLICVPREETLYNVTGIAVDVSAVHPTDETLKAFLLASIPSLDSALRTDRFTAALLLLHWASSVADLGSSKAPNPIMTASGMTAAELYYEFFLADLGGSSCGGIATFYNKILRLFGYNSFTVDCGFDVKTRLTHVTCIVPVTEDDGIRLYLLDPTFRGYFVDAEGRPQDITELLKGGAVEQMHNVRFSHAEYVTRDVVIPIARKLKAGFNGACEPVIRNPSLKVCRGYQYSWDQFLVGWGKRLAAAGVEDTKLLLVKMLRSTIFTIGPCPEPHFRGLFIEAVIAGGAVIRDNE